jgi:xanthine phosphoribosyltransferase
MNKLIINDSEYKHLVSKISREIYFSKWVPDYVVGITRGGLLPAVMLSHYLSIPMNTLQISLRDNGESESNLWMAEDAYNGKNILIVDDINDSGATLNWLMEDWPSGCFPDDEKWKLVWNNNVRFASIIDNLASNCNVKMDYCGKEINKSEQDVWIEFPYEEWWAK